MTTDQDVKRTIGDRTVPEAREIIYDIHTGLSPHRGTIARVLDDLVEQIEADRDLQFDLDRATGDLENAVETIKYHQQEIAEAVKALRTMEDRLNDIRPYPEDEGEDIVESMRGQIRNILDDCLPEVVDTLTSAVAD